MGPVQEQVEVMGNLFFGERLFNTLLLLASLKGTSRVNFHTCCSYCG